jgi:hypothetical protein
MLPLVAFVRARDPITEPATPRVNAPLPAPPIVTLAEPVIVFEVPAEE